MGGRGSSSGQGRYNGGGGLNPGDIVNERDMIVERGNPAYTDHIDDVLTVSQDMLKEYPEAGLQQFFISELKGAGASTLGYYDGANIGINQAYMNPRMQQAYDECVKSGFHPARGNKTAMQAVAAHEFGHAVTDAVAKKLGVVGLDAAADRICAEARKISGHRGVVQMANSISRYASASNAEAVAEAIADVYCNGAKAAKASRAIVQVIKSYS